jgi:hypothetical protein
MEFDVAFSLILYEYNRATSKFDAFHNAHEGYAVLSEEVDELWDAVKMKGELRDSALTEEAIQVGAMALRFLVDVCNSPSCTKGETEK